MLKKIISEHMSTMVVISGLAISAVMTTLNNVGPGFGVVGPMGSFADYSAFSKIVFSFDMLVGRLEIFPFLILFTAFAWRKKF